MGGKEGVCVCVCVCVCDTLTALKEIILMLCHGLTSTAFYEIE